MPQRSMLTLCARLYEPSDAVPSKWRSEMPSLGLITNSTEKCLKFVRSILDVLKEFVL